MNWWLSLWLNKLTVQVFHSVPLDHEQSVYHFTIFPCGDMVCLLRWFLMVCVENWTPGSFWTWEWREVALSREFWSAVRMRWWSCYVQSHDDETIFRTEKHRSGKSQGLKPHLRRFPHLPLCSIPMPPAIFSVVKCFLTHLGGQKKTVFNCKKKQVKGIILVEIKNKLSLPTLILRVPWTLHARLIYE